MQAPDWTGLDYLEFAEAKTSTSNQHLWEFLLEIWTELSEEYFINFLK